MLFCREQGVKSDSYRTMDIPHREIPEIQWLRYRKNDRPSLEGSVGPWLYSSMDDKVQEKNIIYIEI